MEPGPAEGETPVRVTVRVRGRVQGVGFRWWARARALELGLVGSATNRPDGAVEVVAQGPRAACDTLLVLLQPRAVPPGRPGVVVDVAPWWSAAREVGDGFVER